MTMEASLKFCLRSGVSLVSVNDDGLFFSQMSEETYMLYYQAHLSDMFDIFADCSSFNIEVFAVGSAVAIGDGPVAEKFGVEGKEFGG